MLGGDLLGAYSLSEAHAGSDPAAIAATARRDGSDYVINGSKAWVTHGGEADFYTIMARTGGSPGERDGISCFLVPADTPGLIADPPDLRGDASHRALAHRRRASLGRVDAGGAV